MQSHSTAVQEYARKTAFTFTLIQLLRLYERHGQRKERSTMEYIPSYVEEKQVQYPRIVCMLCALVSALTLMTLLLFLSGIIHYDPALMLAIVSLYLSLLSFMKHARQLSGVTPLAYLIEDYERISYLIEETVFQDDVLCRICSDVEEVCATIKKLRRILMLIQLCPNNILFFPVNTFDLFDFQCAIALQD